jgi:hypothetical protein
MLGARAWITRPWAVPLLGAAVIACGVVLVVSAQPLLVVGVQILLTLIVVAVSIPVTRSLHDAIPSSIRAGVASGVGMLTWLAFVPFALVVGGVSQQAGIGNAGWLFVGVGVVAAVLMLAVLPRARHAPEPTTEVLQPEVAITPRTFPAERFLPPDDPVWPGHWAKLPTAWSDRVAIDSPEVLGQARSAIADMPPALRRVIVLRDLEGRSSDDVERALAISLEEERALLHQARSFVRARLERHLDGTGAAS